jgi:hypothetical protein
MYIFLFSMTTVLGIWKVLLDRLRRAEKILSRNW